MIKQCTAADFETILDIINRASQAYVNVVPDDCLHVPYMSANELASEISAGIIFWGWFESGKLVGVMGIQRVLDATLITHAHVLRKYQGKSIGGRLLSFLIKLANGHLLVGTWADTQWAIRFYERYGFELVGKAEKDHLLTRYWNISARQTETSVVLKYSAREAT